MENLKKNCLTCKKCNLSNTRTNVVFGEGNDKSFVMFIGEAPGKNEDLNSRPFVGSSGKLLDSLLAEVGFYRNLNIYITNIVKCRPPKNRDPKIEERENCIPWLNKQIKLINPKIIVTLGRISSKIIDTKIKISQDHGKFIFKDKILFFPIYHPSAIIYDREKINYVRNDLIVLKNKYEEFKKK